MTLAWALSALMILLAALGASRLLRGRGPAAARHLVLATAFAVVAAAPLAVALLPRFEPVRRMQSTVVMVVSGDEAPPAREALPGARFEAAAVAQWLWIAGAALLLGRMAFAADFRRRYASPAATPVREMGDRIAAQLGLTREVRFETSGAVLVAETSGALRPRVTLPEDAEGWPAERLRVVLTHELIHVLRHDWLATVLAEAVAAVHWFNPLAWLAVRELRRERELACDDAVLASGVNGCDYAAHLLDIVSGLRNRPCAPAVAMAQTSHLETRIRSILKPNTPRGGITMKARIGAAAFATCLLIAVTAVQAPAQNGSAALSGTVIDSSSARVPNASVIVRNAETRKAEIVRSNEAGEFSFNGLPAGTYDIEVAKAGFQLFRQNRLVLAPGSAQVVTALLNLGRISETINVVGEGARAQAADAATPPQRLRVGGNVQHAKLVNQVRPPYPPHLKAAGVEGTVLMEAVIARDGTVQNLQVLNTLVHPDLVQAATEAVRQWQWEPTYLNGVPVEILTQINVNFTLSK